MKDEERKRGWKGWWDTWTWFHLFFNLRLIDPSVDRFIIRRKKQRHIRMVISFLETVVIDSFPLFLISFSRKRERVWRKEIEEVSSLNFWRFFNCDPLGVLSFQKEETKIWEREKKRRRKQLSESETQEWVSEWTNSLTTQFMA